MLDDAPGEAPLRVTLLYHFFHPDDVVSARHFCDLAVGLTRRGWQVNVFTSNRYCRYKDRRIALRDETWEGVRIRRVARPALDQASSLGRVANLAFMLAGWSWLILRSPPGLYLSGTDPQFSQLIFPLIKLRSRRNVIALWAFDLYPEAIIADRPGTVSALIGRAILSLMGPLYRMVDVIADLGPCMRRRLDRYRPRARRETLVPWALVEATDVVGTDSEVRAELFGEGTGLGLLYSGNLGRAHEFEPFLALARSLRESAPEVRFCFAVRGNRSADLQAALTPSDTNVTLAGFAGESELAKRLAAADIHLLSLREGWEGIVVPSKFFGSIAAGRPVLYFGPPDTTVAEWIRELDIGLVLDDPVAVTERLIALAGRRDELRAWQERVLAVHRQKFAKNVVLDKFDRVLREEIGASQRV